MNTKRPRKTPVANRPTPWRRLADALAAIEPLDEAHY